MRPQVTFVWSDRGWVAHCSCGHDTRPRYTLEAAGRAFDEHMAAKFPNGSQRFPCPTLAHGAPFEFDPTPLEIGEGRVNPNILQRHS